MSNRTVFTIGHSAHEPSVFIGLLRQHGISAVADVRSSPYSRFAPAYNRETLTRLLAQADIKYVFLGEELGARSSDPQCYEAGRVQYRRLAATGAFRRGLERVEAGARSFTLALLCAEKEPLECHRTILVARELVARDSEVIHILGTGDLETHRDAMQRLLRLLRSADKVGQADLWRTESEILDEAYAMQEARIAYVDVSSTTHSGE